MEQLRPLPNSIKPSGAEAIEEAPRPSREEERKKAMYIRTKAPQRKVFEGGRHTRALSLLSPTSLSNRGATFGSIDGIKNNSANVAVQSVPNSAIGKAPRSPSHIRAQPSKGTKEDLVNTGKQLVGDIREGLWTFIEDLRQATVGDEAVAPSRQKQLTPNRASMPPRSRPPIQSPVSKRNSHFLGLQDDFSNWDTEPQPIVEDEVLSAPVKKTPNETVKDESASDDGWDNWDSPPAKTTGSPSFSTTAGSSPRTSMR